MIALPRQHCSAARIKQGGCFHFLNNIDDHIEPGMTFIQLVMAV